MKTIRFKFAKPTVFAISYFPTLETLILIQASHEVFYNREIFFFFHVETY